MFMTWIQNYISLAFLVLGQASVATRALEQPSEDLSKGVGSVGRERLAVASGYSQKR
jgi:hypothetical protein